MLPVSLLLPSGRARFCPSLLPPQQRSSFLFSRLRSHKTARAAPVINYDFSCRVYAEIAFLQSRARGTWRMNARNSRGEKSRAGVPFRTSAWRMLISLPSSVLRIRASGISVVSQLEDQDGRHPASVMRRTDLARCVIVPRESRKSH